MAIRRWSIFVGLAFNLLLLNGAIAEQSATAYETTDPWTLVAATKNGDSKALPVLKARAQNGDVKAQLALGELYLWPQEGMTDAKQAFKWFRMAAEQGNAGAEETVGGMYAAGHGTEQDYAKAAQFFRKSAEQGNTHAQKQLADLYLDGSGVKQDYEEAYFWYLLSEPFLGDLGHWGCLEDAKCSLPDDRAGKHLDFATKCLLQLKAIGWKPVVHQPSAVSK